MEPTTTGKAGLKSRVSKHCSAMAVYL